MQLERPNSTYGLVSNVTAAGQSFTTALRAVTHILPVNPWDIQLSSPSTAPVSTGDILAGEIWLRRPASGEPVAELIFEQSSTPYSQSFSRIIAPVGTNWTRFRFAFASAGNYATGGAQFNIRLGYAVQRIDLGGLTLTNYGQTFPLSSFSNDFTYPGRDPDAPWRLGARQAIDWYRKTDLRMVVEDQDGFPIRHAGINVRMLRHAFGFGSAVDGATLLGSGGDNDRYRGIITNWFNKVVLENDLKWPQWENNPGTARKALQWLNGRGIPVRGHNLIWPGTNQPYYLPADIPALLGDTNRLRLRIDSHFTNILSAVHGQCTEWDVINEATHLTTLRNVLGDAEMVHWFKLAHSLEPDSLLFFNEYQNLETPPGSPAARDKLYNVVRYLQTNGAPIQAIGLQSHFGGYLTSPDDLMTYLTRYAELGLVLEATEFDVNATDEAMQADYLRDFMTVCFSQPAVNGVIMWGFWEKRHWLPAAALIRADWTLKPNALAWTNLVFGEWWTMTSGVSDATGLASIRAFKGDYAVEVHSGDLHQTNLWTVASNNLNRVVLNLPPPGLHAVANNSRLELSWENRRSGFQLMKSISLSSPHWIPAGLARDDGTNWVLSLKPQETAEYYQLQR